MFDSRKCVRCDGRIPGDPGTCTFCWADLCLPCDEAWGHCGGVLCEIAAEAQAEEKAAAASDDHQKQTHPPALCPMCKAAAPDIKGRRRT